MRAHRKSFGYGFTLLVILAVLGIGVPAMASDAAWYDGSWSHRKPVTIDHTKVVADQKDFPVLINLGGDPDLSYKAQGSGKDIIFTLSDGTSKIPVKVESYTSATGALVAWVKVPALSSSVDTQLFMYFGNPDATGQQDDTGTWKDVYKGNWRKRDIVSWVQTEYNNHNNPSGFSHIGATEMKEIVVVPGAATTQIPTAGATPVPTVEPTADIAPTQTTVWNDCGWSYRKAITINHEKVVTDQADFPVLVSLTTDWGLAAHAQTTGNDILFTLPDEVTKVPHKIESYTASNGALVAWVKVPALSSSVNTVLYMYYGNPASPTQQDTAGNWSYQFKGTWNRKTVASWILTKYNNQMSPSTFYSLGSELYQPQSCGTPAPTVTPTPTPTPAPIPVPASATLPVDPTPEPTITPPPKEMPADPTPEPTITQIPTVTPVDPTPTGTPVDPTQTITPTPEPTAEPTPEPTPVPFSCPGGTNQLVTDDASLAGCVSITNDWTYIFNETGRKYDSIDTVTVSYRTADSYCLVSGSVGIGYDTAALPPAIDLTASRDFDTQTCATEGTLDIVLPDLGDIPSLFVTPTVVVQKVAPEGSAVTMTAGVPAPDNPIYYFIQ